MSKKKVVPPGQVAVATTWNMDLWPVWRKARTPEDFQKMLDSMKGAYQIKRGMLEGRGEEIPTHVRMIASAELAVNESGIESSLAIRNTHLTVVYDPNTRNLHFTEIDMGSPALGDHADHIPRIKRLVIIEDETQIDEIVYDYRGGMNTRTHQLYYRLGMVPEWKQIYSTFPRTMRHFSNDEGGTMPTSRKTFWNEVAHAFGKVQHEFSDEDRVLLTRLCHGNADVYTRYRSGTYTVEERRFVMDHYVKLNHVIFRRGNPHKQFHGDVIKVLIELANMAPPLRKMGDAQEVIFLGRD